MPADLSPALPRPLWRVHELKTWPEPFAALLTGLKTHEVRKNDRDFRVGDLLRLREWEPRAGHPDGGWHTGREVWREVTYISQGGTWGLPEGLCVLSVCPPADAGRAA